MLHKEGGSKRDEIKNKIKWVPQVTHTVGMSKDEKEITANCSKRVKGGGINIELNAEDTGKMESLEVGGGTRTVQYMKRESNMELRRSGN